MKKIEIIFYGFLISKSGKETLCSVLGRWICYLISLMTCWSESWVYFLRRNLRGWIRFRRHLETYVLCRLFHVCGFSLLHRGSRWSVEWTMHFLDFIFESKSFLNATESLIHDMSFYQCSSPQNRPNYRSSIGHEVLPRFGVWFSQTQTIGRWHGGHISVPRTGWLLAVAWKAPDTWYLTPSKYNYHWWMTLITPHPL